MSTTDSRDGRETKKRAVNRRNILLGGTTLAAVSTMGSAAPVKLAQAQAQPVAPAGRKPNILVIFGDDIGLWNVSA